MFTPREVQNFIRMFDVLSDPVKYKSILQELEAKTAHAEAKLVLMDERENELSRREKRCAAIEADELKNRDANLREQSEIAARNSVLESRNVALKSIETELRSRQAAIEEREDYLTARENEQNARDAKLAELELRMEQKAKELDAKIAEVESQKARLKEIVG